jgi:hypothetical protein
MCILSECQNKDKYGEYCCKHRREYLINNNQICFEKFTDKESDYLKKDIITTIESIHHTNYEEIRFKKKKEAFIVLQQVFQQFEKYDAKDIHKIATIQQAYQLRKEKTINHLRGEGFLDKSLSNNDTDFFTYETSDEINDKYYFSYTDEKGFVWFFDIRSFNKLIEFKQANPYTMSIIPKSTVRRSKLLTKKLKLGVSDEVVDQNQLQVSRKQMIKQKCTDLFCDIDTSGYYCQPIWFMNLNIHLLKKLYRNLEDLWNFRLQITNEIKSRISPPNGLVFTTRVSDVNHYLNRDNIRDLILNEVMKFKNAESFEDRKLGYMYFIIGMGAVSRECCETHPWLLYV